MSQYNNPKINLQKTHNVKRNTIIASRVTHVTLGLADPSFITIILPSEVQTSLKPYSYLASFSFVIRKEVKLSVTYIFVPLNFLLFMKTFFLVLYLVNFIIIARPFLRVLFLLPIRCVRSISDGWISSPRCSLMLLIRYQYLHFDFLLRHVSEGNFVWNIAPVRQLVQKDYLFYQLIP